MLEVESNALLYFPTCESEESQLDLQDWPKVETTPVHKVHLYTTYAPVTLHIPSA